MIGPASVVAPYTKDYLVFNGTDSSMTIPAAVFDAIGNGDFSISMRVKTGGTQATNGIVFERTSTGMQILRFVAGYLSMGTNTSAANKSITPTWGNNEEHDVCMTYQASNNNLTIYYDDAGVVASKVVAAPVNGTGTSQLGARTSTTKLAFDGGEGKVLIYNVVLTEAEARQNFAPEGYVTRGLVAGYMMDGTPNDILGTNNGTLVGTSTYSKLIKER